MRDKQDSTVRLLARVAGQPGLDLIGSVATADGTMRNQMERFVRSRFADVYGARVSRFMPELLGLCRSGELLAVIGLRPAVEGPLFLETYLDRPACETLRQRSGMPLTREQLVEVGNLATMAPGAARLLISALTHYLAYRGFAWVVFTGTPMLLNSFQRLTLSPVDLGPADPARLGDQQAEWGSYYATQPRVMGGYVPEGLTQLQRRGVLERQGYQPLYGSGSGDIFHACA
jgi:hypothetical protein